MHDPQQPQPTFALGQKVRVILSERNKTVRIGTIREIIWHYKDHRYNYYLEVEGKKVSKRYLEADLEGIS